MIGALSISCEQIGRCYVAHQTNEASAHDFPSGIAKPALRALDAAGYTRLEQLTQITEAELGKLHGMGPKAIGLLRSALDARGLAFAAADNG